MAWEDRDFARAGDYGLFDRQAQAWDQASYPLYTYARSDAGQFSQVLGGTIHATCTARAVFMSWSNQPSYSRGTSHLEYCIRLDRAATLTIVAQASSWSSSDATATSSVVFSGPDGLQLELVLDCTGRVCGPDSLASTQPIPAGDYTLQVEAIANDAGSAAGGDWEASASIGVQVELSEPLVSVAETTWSNLKNLYHDTAR